MSLRQQDYVPDWAVDRTCPQCNCNLVVHDGPQFGKRRRQQYHCSNTGNCAFRISKRYIDDRTAKILVARMIERHLR